MCKIKVSELDNGLILVKAYHAYLGDGMYVKYKVPADNYLLLWNNRALVVKSNNKWNLYLMCYTRWGRNSPGYEGVYLLVTDISEFISEDDAFCYKKDDVWYFLYFKDAAWEIQYSNVRETRVNSFLKLGKNLTKLKKYGNYGEWDLGYGYVVEVDGKKFFAHGGLANVYDECYYNFKEFYKFTPIKGYENFVKAYVNPRNKRKYVLAKWSYEWKQPFSAECTSIEKLNEHFWILKNGKQKSLYSIDARKYNFWEIIPMSTTEFTIDEIDDYKIVYSVSGEKKVYNV